jgi:hypothetical protein
MKIRQLWELFSIWCQRLDKLAMTLADVCRRDQRGGPVIVLIFVELERRSGCHRLHPLSGASKLEWEQDRWLRVSFVVIPFTGLVKFMNLDVNHDPAALMQVSRLSMRKFLLRSIFDTRWTPCWFDCWGNTSSGPPSTLTQGKKLRSSDLDESWQIVTGANKS